MVESGIADKLLKVLSSHNSGEGDIRLQHAILSALRNLSIARQNKPVLVQQVKSILDCSLALWFMWDHFGAYKV